MSAYLTGGNSAKSDRNTDGRTEEREVDRSERVSVNVVGSADCMGGKEEEECDLDANQRLMAVVPASRTIALKSAPTYPCMRDENARSSSCAILCGVLAKRTLRISRRASASGTPVGYQKWLGRFLRCFTYLDFLVKPTWPSQCRVYSIWPVCRSDNHHSPFCISSSFQLFFTLVVPR